MGARELCGLSAVLAFGTGAMLVPVERPPDELFVLVAARDLHPGVPIGEDDVYGLQLPLELLPEGAFVSPQLVIGRVPHERILANEIVRGERLVDAQRGVGLGAVVPSGMRAISVHVSNDAALLGFLNPGNDVDLLVTVPPDAEDGERKPRSYTLLEEVFVLGVHPETQQETRDATVVLLVSPGEAEEIALAESTGQLSLTMVNRCCFGYCELPSLDIDALRQKLQLPRVLRMPRIERSEPRRCRAFTIIQDGEREQILVDQDGIPCDES